MTTIAPQDAADLYEESDGTTIGSWTRIGEQHVRTSRWMEHYWLVLADQDGQRWGVPYAQGLTESQEHDLPWEDATGPLELTRLYPHTVTRVEYRPTPAGVAA